MGVKDKKREHPERRQPAASDWAENCRCDIHLAHGVAAILLQFDKQPYIFLYSYRAAEKAQINTWILYSSDCVPQKAL